MVVILGSRRVSTPILGDSFDGIADACSAGSTVWHLIVLNLDYTPGKFDGAAAGEVSSVSA
jgi:hypothetical protein